MKKKCIEIQMNKIALVLELSKEPLPIKEIFKEVVKEFPNLNQRTLQRRLNKMLQKGLIQALGKGRASRYNWLKTSKEPTKSPSVKTFEHVENISEYLSLPLIKRHPVSYQRKFLDAYQPNSTPYLSNELCEELMLSGLQLQGEHAGGTFAKTIFSRLLIDLSWNSSRLEGNTYSLLETQKLLEEGQASKLKSTFEAQMILNHKEAISFLLENIETISMNKHTICNIHALLSDGLLSDPNSCGAIRKKPLGISSSVYTPIGIRQVIDETLTEILSKAAKIQNPFEQSFFLLVHLPYLQPFEDVNKRVSRIAANIPLMKWNVSPLSFIDVPQEDYINGLIAVYELNKADLLKEIFIWAYYRSCRQYMAVKEEIGEPDPTLFKYRNQLKSAVKNIVSKALKPPEAENIIQGWLNENIPPKDRKKMTTLIKTELSSLHEGNISRYRLSLEEYLKWSKDWKL